uniref:Putative aspartic proteinase CDR1-like n=1 Tax=Davidia involucrata TaxID=16924 RepID=A0A5B6YW60_DAVIN
MDQCFIVLVFSHLPISSLKVEAKVLGGFSIELIHHDSQLYPFYNHSATPGELVRNDVLRSIARVNQLFHRPYCTSIEYYYSMVYPQRDRAEYLMKFSIGSPPVEVLATVDTGSDIVWVQCKPCDQCYQQDGLLFDPMKSSTYTELSCDSESCPQCDNTKKECKYYISYGDDSYSKGIHKT